MKPHLNELTREIIGSAIEVHRALGPGLLEAAYHKCMCRELSLRGLTFFYDRRLPVSYKGIKLDWAYRPDIVVANRVVVECKTVRAIAPIHEAQLLTYLRLGGWPIGLLINFDEVVLRNGIRRRVLGFSDEWTTPAKKEISFELGDLDIKEVPKEEK